VRELEPKCVRMHLIGNILSFVFTFPDGSNKVDILRQSTKSDSSHLFPETNLHHLLDWVKVVVHQAASMEKRPHCSW